ncbi:hypothetical protein ACFO9Q_07990 [Paenibacillus sp. GCM10023252]|uniref:hypothetical protein n=1 Tax=Paenibacillus sp. GCM10023252 TaxID=3252649 RepID=UPI00360C77DA
MNKRTQPKWSWKKSAATAVLSVSLLLPSLVPAKDVYAYGSSLPAPSSTVLTEAYSYASNSFTNFFVNTNGGSAGELKRAQSLFTLARNYIAGDTTTSYKDRLVYWVKQTLNSTAHMPDMHGGIDMRQQQYYLITLALIWHTPDLKAAFTTAEQSRMLLMAKAALAAGAYVTADYNASGVLRTDASRITMDGDPNCWPQGNPNWTEAVLGSFLAGAYIVGVSNVGSFLNSYDHASFKTELSAAGLTDVYDSFNLTANATVNGYVNNIDNNDTAGKPFFRGKKLTDFYADPFRFYYDTTGKFTYTELATEGDQVGVLGRAKEFATTDAYGVRDSLGYVLHGLNHSIGNRYLIDFMGDWSGTSSSTQRTDIENRMKVGFSDVLGKAENGYWNISNGNFYYDTAQDEIYYSFFRSLADDMGLFKQVLFRDNFEDANYTGWTATGAWSILSTEPTWSGSTTQQDDVVQLPAASGVATLISSYSGSNYIVYAPVKVSAWGTSAYRNVGIVGKYVNNNDYYVMRYKQDNGMLQIVKYKGGSTQILKETPFTWNLGTVYQLKGVFGSDGKLDFYVNGGAAPKLTATDTEYLTGNAGYYASFTNAKFDDMLVTGR